MRERHLRAFTDLETERDDITRELTALAMLYHKKDNQITCRATITPSTPATLAAIITQSGIEDLAAYLHGPTGDLSRHPGVAVMP